VPDDEQAYLDEIRALSFEGRDWTPAAIEAMRDFLSPWNHNIRLAPGIYTVFDEDPYPEHQAIMDVVDDQLGGGYTGRRVLDLGCLEGYFSLECALHGADVLGVDAREINLKKCEFVRSVLGVPNLRFALDDAMGVTRERYGSFDVVLALGLLYHLDDPFTFLAQVAELCEGFLVLDTLVALEDAPQTIDGWEPELSDVRDLRAGAKSYRGRLYREFQEGADEVEHAFSTTASHKNEISIWLTEGSLVSLLGDVGFERLDKVVSPRREDSWWSDPSDGRVLYVARRRRRFASRVFGPLPT
jgi:SAM-dependent methyltransferase